MIFVRILRYGVETCTHAWDDDHFVFAPEFYSAKSVGHVHWKRGMCASRLFCCRQQARIQDNVGLASYASTKTKLLGKRQQ